MTVRFRSTLVPPFERRVGRTTLSQIIDTMSINRRHFEAIGTISRRVILQARDFLPDLFFNPLISCICEYRGMIPALDVAVIVSIDTVQFRGMKNYHEEK